MDGENFGVSYLPNLLADKRADVSIRHNTVILNRFHKRREAQIRPCCALTRTARCDLMTRSFLGFCVGAHTSWLGEDGGED